MANKRYQLHVRKGCVRVCGKTHSISPKSPTSIVASCCGDAIREMGEMRKFDSNATSSIHSNTPRSFVWCQQDAVSRPEPQPVIMWPCGTNVLGTQCDVVSRWLRKPRSERLQECGFPTIAQQFRRYYYNDLSLSNILIFIFILFIKIKIL